MHFKCLVIIQCSLSECTVNVLLRDSVTLSAVPVSLLELEYA